jgi:hypothetical protein
MDFSDEPDKPLQSRKTFSPNQMRVAAFSSHDVIHRIWSGVWLLWIASDSIEFFIAIGDCNSCQRANRIRHW